jgi:hypothetical protein
MHHTVYSICAIWSQSMKLNYTEFHIIKKRSVVNEGIKLYNNLPLELKNVSDFKSFKKKLKCYLLNSSFYSLPEFLCKKGKWRFFSNICVLCLTWKCVIHSFMLFTYCNCVFFYYILFVAMVVDRWMNVWINYWLAAI